MNEAEVVFTDILGCDRSSLYLKRGRRLGEDTARRVSLVLKRRFCAEPLEYILGKTEFMGLEFKLTPAVFIPRPETEILVETAIRYTLYAKRYTPCVKILDVGTGSGCIAVSLGKFLPDACIDAIDISVEALEIAKANAKLNRVSVNFMQGDLSRRSDRIVGSRDSSPQGTSGFSTCGAPFNTYGLQPHTYDLIVSNPPYIPTAEIERLQPELQHEPRIALDGGEDGLDFYRAVALQAQLYLKEQGLLITEIGYNQKECVLDIFQKSGLFEAIDIVQDYSGIDRVVVLKKIHEFTRMEHPTGKPVVPK